MVTKIKQMLLTDYIGAIVIAILIGEGISSFFAMAWLTLQTWSYQPSSHSVLDERVVPKFFPWETVVGQLVVTGIQFAVA